MTQSSHLSLRKLNISLEDFSLKNLDLEVRQGEYFVLLGPTGAGKTVLLEALAGIIPLQSGSILLEGTDITVYPPELRRVGFVYQDFALFPHLTVAGNISFGLQNSWRMADYTGDSARKKIFPLPWMRLILKGKSHQQAIKAKVEQISSLFKIRHLLERSPNSLSGGEKQRVAMARALITTPQILLLDEPLSSLDPETREGIQRELRRIHQELGTTTLHITHNFEVAAALADRIGVIMDGKIVQLGTPREIFRQPDNEKVAQFVGVRNIFRGRHFVEEDGGGILQLDGFKFASISGLKGIVRASIRPEDILLSREPLRSSARNNFKGRVVEISDRGSFSYITVRIPSLEQDGKDLNLIVLITRRSGDELALDLGQDIFAEFKASALHIF
ncbi:MAG: ABC transporter [Chloroflexota bacterium]|nr:MAG: ABC transporter [Chloroflexota bacterium]